MTTDADRVRFRIRMAGYAGLEVPSPRGGVSPSRAGEEPAGGVGVGLHPGSPVAIVARPLSWMTRLAFRV